MATVPGTTGTQVNEVELAALSLQQGLSGPNAIMATAIAMAENRGSVSSTGAFITTNVLNDTEGKVAPKDADYSVGPWQINFTANAGGRNRLGSSPELASNPFENARLMAIISDNGTNWAPWSTSHSSNGLPPPYLAFIPLATAAVGAAAVGGITKYLDDISARLGGSASPGGGSGGGTPTNPVNPGGSGGGSGGGSTPGTNSGVTDVTPGFLIVFVAFLLLIIGAIIWGKVFSVQGPKQVIQIGPRGSSSIGTSAPKIISQPIPKPPSGVVSRTTKATGAHTYHTRTVVVRHVKK